MDSREELIRELNKMAYASISQGYIHKVADFILKDRERIVNPIFAYKLSVIETEQNWGLRKSDKAINETLKNAGVQP